MNIIVHELKSGEDSGSRRLYPFYLSIGQYFRRDGYSVRDSGISTSVTQGTNASEIYYRNGRLIDNRMESPIDSQSVLTVTIACRQEELEAIATFGIMENSGIPAALWKCRDVALFQGIRNGLDISRFRNIGELMKILELYSKRVENSDTVIMHAVRLG